MCTSELLTILDELSTTKKVGTQQWNQLHRAERRVQKLTLPQRKCYSTLIFAFKAMLYAREGQLGEAKKPF